MGIRNLVGNLALLGVKSVYLCTDALALLGQAGVVAANLVACGLPLPLQHFNLIVNVVELLLGYGTIGDQLREALAFALGVGNLLINRRKLLLQVEAATVSSTACSTQLTFLRLQLFAGLLQLIGVDASHHGSLLDGLSFADVDGLQFTRCLRRHGYFRCLEGASGIIFLFFVSASGKNEGNHGQTIKRKNSAYHIN